MFTLSLAPGAQADLRRLATTDGPAAAMIVAVLQEIQGDPSLLDALTIHDFEDVFPETEHDFNVKHWWEHYRKGRNLWRLKVIDSKRSLLRYRVIYGYAMREQAYYVLGIVHRDHCYVTSHPDTQRILREYFEYCE
jgi:hypothetical protein